METAATASERHEAEDLGYLESKEAAGVIWLRSPPPPNADDFEIQCDALAHRVFALVLTALRFLPEDKMPAPAEGRRDAVAVAALLRSGLLDERQEDGRLFFLAALASQHDIIGVTAAMDALSLCTLPEEIWPFVVDAATARLDAALGLSAPRDVHADLPPEAVPPRHVDPLSPVLRAEVKALVVTLWNGAPIPSPEDFPEGMAMRLVEATAMALSLLPARILPEAAAGRRDLKAMARLFRSPDVRFSGEDDEDAPALLRGMLRQVGRLGPEVAAFAADAMTVPPIAWDCVVNTALRRIEAVCRKPGHTAEADRDTGAAIVAFIEGMGQMRQAVRAPQPLDIPGRNALAGLLVDETDIVEAVESLTDRLAAGLPDGVEDDLGIGRAFAALVVWHILTCAGRELPREAKGARSFDVCEQWLGLGRQSIAFARIRLRVIQLRGGYGKEAAEDLLAQEDGDLAAGLECARAMLALPRQHHPDEPLAPSVGSAKRSLLSRLAFWRR